MLLTEELAILKSGIFLDFSIFILIYVAEIANLFLNCECEKADEQIVKNRISGHISVGSAPQPGPLTLSDNSTSP